ncbi:MAG: hypothetical protein IJR84_09175 [Bacteroidaceae bacterium]|nr:hypothetical protein [Bacteroidaceae bacterium]
MQLMLADGAKMKSTSKDGKTKDEPTRKLNKDELKAFFNNRNASLRKGKR